MADAPTGGPLARSPVAPPPPVVEAHGWEVSARRSEAALRLCDCTPMAKVLLRAPAGGPTAEDVGVARGAAVRDGSVLVAGTGPGEWLLLGDPGQAGDLARRHGAPAGATGGDHPGDRGTELVTVLDVTHGRALLRLTGEDAPAALAKACATDLEDRAVPHGRALRTLVAGIAVEVVRDDSARERSYLLACDREAGQYLFDALLDAGAEFGIDVEGFATGGPARAGTFP